VPFKFNLRQYLVDDFIRPTLLVGLFKPPEELSAAVTMELLYYYALAHQDSFDVRWIARVGLSLSGVSDLLHGQYWPSSIEPCFDCKIT
jgi:hypothetical protein